MSSAKDTPASSHSSGPKPGQREVTRPHNPVIRLSDFRRKKTGRIFFTRAELSELLALYSAHVSQGDWRDYAIDHAQGIAIFSVFRHTNDRALFSIAKIPLPKGVEFSVFDVNRRISRSSSLSGALDCLKRPLLKVIRDHTP